MKLYLKILAYLKPLWKLIVVSILLSLFYILFNNVSLWISVDFVRELFSPHEVTTVRTGEDQTEEITPESRERQEGDLDRLMGVQESVTVYKKINKRI